MELRLTRKGKDQALAMLGSRRPICTVGQFRAFEAELTRRYPFALARLEADNPPSSYWRIVIVDGKFSRPERIYVEPPPETPPPRTAYAGGAPLTRQPVATLAAPHAPKRKQPKPRPHGNEFCPACGGVMENGHCKCSRVSI